MLLLGNQILRHPRFCGFRNKLYRCLLVQKTLTAHPLSPNNHSGGGMYMSRPMYGGGVGYARYGTSYKGDFELCL